VDPTGTALSGSLQFGRASFAHCASVARQSPNNAGSLFHAGRILAGDLVPYKCHRGDLSEATEARAPQSSPTLGRKLPGPLVDALGSRGLAGGPSFRRQDRSLGFAPMLNEPRHARLLGAGHLQALGTEHLTHTTQRPVVPPNAKPAARGRACGALQGVGRASRSSLSGHCDSFSSRRIRRRGQFSHWNGAVGGLGVGRSRGNRPRRLASVCDCTTRC